MNTSVIIPARNEKYLGKTIDDIFEKAEGEIEVIAILDGYWPSPPIPDRPNLTLVHHTEPIGMRAAINQAAILARGKYLMKCDAHCMFDKGFDSKLIAECRPDWTVVPRRFALDVEKWERGKQKCDYQYIRQEDFKGRDWKEFESDKPIHDLMTFQGSCWFMHRQRFFDLECLDDINYGFMGKEAQEICLKSWLSGGKCAIHKKTWYAHWDKKERGYSYPKEVKEKSRSFAIDFWTNNRWPKQTRKFQWLIDNFDPPTWEPVLTCEPEEEKKQIEVVVPDTPEINKEEAVVEITDLRSYFVGQRLISRIQLSPITVRGFTRAEHLYKLFKDMGFKKGVEIGTQGGRNARKMCEAIPGLDLTVVDPWFDYKGIRVPQIEKHKNFYKNACARLKPFNVTIMRAKGMDVVNDFPFESLDFVYIDGNHKFDYVMEDLIAWSRRVRKGGVISGHDYYRFRRGGIVDAVDYYTKAHKVPEFFLCDEKTPSFFWRKT